MSLFRLFLVMIVLCMAAEIGGIIALTVFEKSVMQRFTSFNILQIFYRLVMFCIWAGKRSTRRARISFKDRYEPVPVVTPNQNWVLKTLLFEILVYLT